MIIQKESLLKFWGILDIAAIGWYILLNLVKGKIPFYADLSAAKSIATNFGGSSPMILTYVSLLLYLSLFLSGYLLLKGNKYGTILSYVQCPFRIIGFMPLSLFFLTWPVKYIFGMPSRSGDPLQELMQLPVIVFILLRLLSEIIKTATVVKWSANTNSKFEGIYP